MSKNIKRIIAVVMAIGTISAVSPTMNTNLLTTRAYASTTNGTTELDSLKLETSSGSTIKIYSDKDYASDNKVNSGSVSKGDTYYAKTSESTVSINTDGPSSKYVRVFKGTSNSTKGKKISSDISLSSGTNTLTIRVYNEEPDSSITYDDDSDVASEYIIKVKCTSSDTSSSSDSYDDIYLSKLSIDGESISLSDSKTTYTYNVASNVDQVVVKATPKDEDTDTVEIDDDKVDSSDKYKKTVSLDKGENEVEVKLTNDDDEERVYTLKINRGGSTSSNSTSSTTAADDYDEIYLEKLSVDGTAISLSDSKINYSYNVASDVDEVVIKATPQDTDADTVEIDNEEVTSSDKYKKTVSLKKGENKIEIDLTNDNDEERVYTLKITRGASTADTTTSSTTTATSSPSTATEITTAKVSQWVQANGAWKYNDATGNPVKNSWVQNYYVKDDGSMVTGWFQIGGPWYYFGTDGARKTGWQQVNNVWYYLESAEGKMKTGWMKDTNGKYYYLNDNGSMASNTTIQGYKLGSDGAWVK
jgi:glucan-binding YG repeat protein